MRYIAAAILLFAPLYAEEPAPKKPSRQVLIELFTSQG